MELLEPDQRLAKSTLRRGWLLVLLVMVVFIILTKVFPAGETGGPTPPLPAAGAAAPSH